MGLKLETPGKGRKVPDYQHLLDVAVAAAETAAEYIRTAERPDRDAWGHKGQSDFVTEIDRGAEARIARILTEQVPDSTVWGEELSPHASSKPITWVVDPLDGTTNYLHGYPSYAVSIAALHDGLPVAGTVINIPRCETYTALRGGGAWHGGHRLTVSPIDRPAAALIGTGFPFKALDLLPQYLTQFDTILRRTSGIRRAGAAALDLVDVAAGRFQGFWEPQLAPWDVAAGVLLVREAGGTVTDLAGSEDVIGHGSIVAGNRAIHQWLLETLPR